MSGYSGEKVRREELRKVARNYDEAGNFAPAALKAAQEIKAQYRAIRNGSRTEFDQELIEHFRQFYAMATIEISINEGLRGCDQTMGIRQMVEPLFLWAAGGAKLEAFPEEPVINYKEEDRRE